MDCGVLGEVNSLSPVGSIRGWMSPPGKADQQISVSGKKVGRGDLRIPYNSQVSLTVYGIVLMWTNLGKLFLLQPHFADEKTEMPGD